MYDSTKRILAGVGLIAEIGGEIAYTPKGKELKSKVEKTIRKHMGLAGGEELELPLFIDYMSLKIDKKILLGRHLTSFKTSSKNGTDYLLARTSEELAANYFSKNKNSRLVYQIRTKFRNEDPRELSALKRKEFTMMDAYSFDQGAEKMEATYQKVKLGFCRLLTELGIEYYIQLSKDQGTISEEFISKIKNIELGHIFHLENLYTKPYGLSHTLMGSYGLGVDRLMAVLTIAKKDFDKISIPDMKEGVGIDTEDVSYFKKRPYSENKALYQRIFTPKEIAYCLSKLDPYPSFTGRFCAKEAFVKAIKQPIKDLREIEIGFRQNKPFIKYEHVIASLSISHTKDRAIAIVSLKNQTKYVFLPGLGINSSFINSLKANLEGDMYFFDLPGHSYKPIDRKNILTIQKIVTLLEKELKENHIEKPILIGYSYGGFVAMHYALKNPVEKLILINTSPETVLKDNHLTILKERHKDKFIGEYVDFSALRRETDAQLSDEIYKSMPLKTLMSYWKSTLKYNLTDKLNQITCPLLVIAGKKDRTIPKIYTEKFRSITDNIHYVKGGHYLPLTNSKEVSELILNQERL